MTANGTPDKTDTMTPQEFLSLRHRLDLTAAELAREMGLSGARAVYKYEHGEREIPLYIAKHLRLIVRTRQPRS